MVEVGDWIVGTGGADPRTSSGNGTLIYAMRVDKKSLLDLIAEPTVAELTQSVKMTKTVASH